MNRPVDRMREIVDLQSQLQDAGYIAEPALVAESVATVLGLVLTNRPAQLVLLDFLRERSLLAHTNPTRQRGILHSNRPDSPPRVRRTRNPSLARRVSINWSRA